MCEREKRSVLWLAVVGAAVWAIFFCFSSGSLRAQDVRPLPIESALRMKHLGRWRELSPDGRWLAYGVREMNRASPSDDTEFARTGIPFEASACDIRLANTQTFESRSLTEGKGYNWSPAWSPDGRYLAFLSDRDGSGQAKLWLWESATNELKKVADTPIRSAGGEPLQWSSDSQRVFLTTLPAGMSVERYVARVTFGGAARDRAAEVGSPLSASSVVVYGSTKEEMGEAHGTLSPTLSVEGNLHDIASIDVRTGTLRTIATGKRISKFRLSRDGALLAYSTPVSFEKAGSQQILYDLFAIALRTSTETRLVSSVRLTLGGSFSLSPDGSELSYRTGGAEERALDVYVVPTAGGKPRNLTHWAEQEDKTTLWKPQWPYSFTAVWSDDGRYLYCITAGKLWRLPTKADEKATVMEVTGRKVRWMMTTPSGELWTFRQGKFTAVITHDQAGKQDGLYQVNLETGKTAKIIERGECYTCASGFEQRLVSVRNEDTSIFYTSEGSEWPQDIWRLKADSDETTRLTVLNPDFAHTRMGKSKLVEWLDADGKRLRGALLLPSGYEPGRKYPLVVDVYGNGPLSDSFDWFGGPDRGMPYLNTQLLATRGYAVFMPDAPQSVGTPMLDLAKTVLPGVNRVIEMGIADPDRLGVMGHSYGGYSTLALLVQTKRFKAAVEANGMANLIGLYGEMNKDGSAFGTSAESDQELMGGTPWQFPTRYIENSPLFYLDRVETPLLVMHGEQDSTISSFLGDEIFVALRRLGKIVVYAKYRGEDHELMSYSNQLDSCKRMLDWFEEYIKPGSLAVDSKRVRARAGL